MTGAAPEVDERAGFARVSLADRYAQVADTRGFFRNGKKPYFLLWEVRLFCVRKTAAGSQD